MNYYLFNYSGREGRDDGLTEFWETKVLIADNLEIADKQFDTWLDNNDYHHVKIKSITIEPILEKKPSLATPELTAEVLDYLNSAFSHFESCYPANEVTKMWRRKTMDLINKIVLT